MGFSSFLLFCSPIFLYLAVVRQHQQEQREKVYASARASNPSLRRQSDRSQDTKVGHLWNQLIGLSGGDKALAERLVESAQRGKPLMGDRWYLEKAIHDLIRDRSRWDSNTLVHTSSPANSANQNRTVFLTLDRSCPLRDTRYRTKNSSIAPSFGSSNLANTVTAEHSNTVDQVVIPTNPSHPFKDFWIVWYSRVVSFFLTIPLSSAQWSLFFGGWSMKAPKTSLPSSTSLTHKEENLNDHF